MHRFRKLHLAKTVFKILCIRQLYVFWTQNISWQSIMFKSTHDCLKLHLRYCILVGSAAPQCTTSCLSSWQFCLFILRNGFWNIKKLIHDGRRPQIMLHNLVLMNQKMFNNFGSNESEVHFLWWCSYLLREFNICKLLSFQTCIILSEGNGSSDFFYLIFDLEWFPLCSYIILNGKGTDKAC